MSSDWSIMSGTVFEHASEPAYVMDPEHSRILAANDAGCELLGYTREELLETPISRIHPSELAELTELLARVLRNGRASTIKLTCRTKTGAFLPTEISLHKLELDGETRILGLVQDRSEHRQPAAHRPEDRAQTAHSPHPAGAATLARMITWHDGPRAPLRHLFELADDSAEQIDDYIERGRVLVARDEANQIIGHAQLVPADRPDTIELKSIAVIPTFRGRGIGRALVERTLAVCRAEGARAMIVTTATADIDNIRFYQRCGFRATSVELNAFTEAKGYPRGLEADGIPVRDSITFALEFGADDSDD